ncbi:MAG TPA: VOC family protein [Alphaproteobacteria bacterium]|nr:VOC family protein [Alphaproteobacteria bacterium]
MSAIELARLDHFVMPCKDVETISDFYVSLLGMRRVVAGNGRVALHYGEQKINLHRAGQESVIRAFNHLSGTQDFCLIVKTPVAEAKAFLEANGVAVIEGPVTREGALGRMTSIYFRDPEDNLVELANYPD